MGCAVTLSRGVACKRLWHHAQRGCRAPRWCVAAAGLRAEQVWCKIVGMGGSAGLSPGSQQQPGACSLASITRCSGDPCKHGATWSQRCLVGCVAALLCAVQRRQHPRVWHRECVRELQCCRELQRSAGPAACQLCCTNSCTIRPAHY
jgi:hypothetical protein